MDNETALNFVAAEPNSGAYDVNPMDSDLASWMLMSGDLLGSSRMPMFDMPPLDDGLMGGQPQTTEMGHYHGNSNTSTSFDAMPVDNFAMPQTNNMVDPMGGMAPSAISSSSSSSQVPVMDAPHHAAGGAVARQQQQQQPQQAAAPATRGRKPKKSIAAGTTTKKASPKRKGAAVAASEVTPISAATRTTSIASNSSTKSSNSNGGDPNDPSLKRQRRLEKNREIARNCRKRKREKYQKLEEEVVKLRQWNKQLEIQLNQGKDGRDKEVARKGELFSMRSLLEKKCTEAEMRQKLVQYKEFYSDFGRERSAAIAFHMNQLKNLLIPNTVSKMTLWSLQQDDEFYDEKKNQRTFGGGIWNMLCSELRLSDEQKKTLLSMRHGIRNQRRNVAECLRILKELDQRVKANFENMSTQMDTVMNSITPTQQARFLLWIERNQACSFMLNNMWNAAAADDSVSTTAGGEGDEEFMDSASTISTMGLSDDGSNAAAEARIKREMAQQQHKMQQLQKEDQQQEPSSKKPKVEVKMEGK